MFLRPGKFRDQGSQVFVALENPLLGSRGRELLNIDTNRGAGFAAIAMWAIGKKSAAAKTLVNQLRIGIGVDEITRGRDL